MRINKIFINFTLILTAFCLISCSSLMSASYKGNLKKVKWYIEKKGADVNQKDKYGWTPLMWAAYYNYYSVAQYLLQKGADPNQQAEKRYWSLQADSTPLIIASYYNHIGVVRLLLRYEAKVNIIDASGNTAFFYAEKYSFSRLIQLLQKGEIRNIKRDTDSSRLNMNQLIHLKDGSKIVGNIISQTRTHVTIKTKYTTIKVHKNNIKEMKYK